MLLGCKGGPAPLYEATRKPRATLFVYLVIPEGSPGKILQISLQEMFCSRAPYRFVILADVEEKTRNGILSTLSVNPPRKQRMSFRQRSVTYVKSFLRAFTREKRYPTCFKFRFVSSPLLAEGDRSSRRVGAIEHSCSYAFVDA